MSLPYSYKLRHIFLSEFHHQLEILCTKTLILNLHVKKKSPRFKK